MTNPAPTPPRESLLALSSRGAAWSLSSQFLGQVLHLGIRIILARLLAPEDFGLVAMVLVFLSAAGIFTELSFGAALVQRTDITDEHRNGVFWCVGLSSLFFAILFAVGAPVVGAFYGNPDVVPLVRVLGLSLILGFPNSVFQAFFTREMDFKTLGIRKIGSTLVGGAGGIAAALSGCGAWALVIDHLLNVASASAWMVLRSSWRPSWAISPGAVGELWRYSRHLVAAHVVNYFNRNLDNILVGKFLGAGPLGFYSFAYQGVVGPLQYLARPLAAVGFPAFSKLQSDVPAARRAYLQTLSAVAVVCMPLIGGLFFFSPWIIPWAIGTKWAPAIIPFQILCVVSAIQVLISLSPPVFNGLGRPDFLLAWTVIALMFNTAGFVIGLRWGVTGVASGYLLAVFLSFPIHLSFLCRILSVSFFTLVSFLLRAAIVLATAGVGSMVLRAASVETTPAPLWFVALGAGVVLSACISFVLFRDGWYLIQRSAITFLLRPRANES